jgi:hypothetical protein
MRLPDGIKGWLLSGTIGGVSAAIAFLCGNIYGDLKPVFLTHVFPTVPRDTLLALVGLLGMGVVLLISWVIYLHSRDSVIDRLKGYDFGPITGIATHRNTKKHYCTRCLLEDNLASPLIGSELGGTDTWTCIRKDCKTRYSVKDGT